MKATVTVIDGSSPVRFQVAPVVLTELAPGASMMLTQAELVLNLFL